MKLRMEAFFMSNKVGIKYPLEIKMKAIEMKQDGIPVKTIQEALNIKSESQVYAWWYWYRDGDLHRLEQPAGKQYTFGHGPEGTTKEEVLLNQNRSLKAHNEILKKYIQLERRWYLK